MEKEMEVPPWRRRVQILGAVLLVIGLVYWMVSDDAFEHSDLELLPKASSLLVVINVDAIYNSDLGEVIRDAFSDEIRDLEKKMREETGLAPEDLSYVVIGGNVASNDPVVILAFEDEPAEEGIAKLVKSLRVRDGEPRKVDGHRVWGSESDRTAMLEIRAGTYLIARRADVDHALAVLDDGGKNELAELMEDHDLLDAPVAVVFDWRTISGLPRELQRELRGIAPALSKHIGPILARAEIDDGIAAEWMLLDTDNEIVVRTKSEIEGDFLESLIRDVARFARKAPPSMD